MKSSVFWDITPYRIRGSHSGGYEELYLLGYKAVWPVENQPTFRRNMSPPSSESKNKQVSCSAYSSILKMEETCSSEKSDDFQRDTRRHILEDRELFICFVMSLSLITTFPKSQLIKFPHACNFYLTNEIKLEQILKAGKGKVVPVLN
jgi:hypothetical protein